MHKQHKSAFTLVELIVVITILAILGTIAFISLQGYSKTARDSRRISDISNIKTSLELFSLNTGNYPIPDNAETVTYSGETVRTQGTLGNNVTTNLSRNLQKKPTDPLFDTEYIYSIAFSKKEFEVLSIHEGDLANNNLLNNTYAGTSYNPKIDGNYNQIFIKTQSYILPTPSIITSENITGGLALDNTNIDSQIITGGNNFPNIGIPNTVQKVGELDITLSATGTINKDSTSEEKESVITAIQGAYTGSTLATQPTYANILNTTTPVILAEQLILNIPSGTTQAESTNYTCDDTTKPTDNGHISFTVGTPTIDNQAYVQDASNCGYSCTDSYTGTSCETAPTLITQSECENDAGWIWVSNDVYIGSTQGNGFCISPRFGDWNADSNLGDGGISFNGWGNHTDTWFQGWDASNVDDYDYATYSLGNPYPQYGQTRKLDSNTGYTCVSLNSGSSDVDGTYGDTIVGRMKWLATTGNDYTQAQSIDWITGATPPNGHSIPALYIADCIDGVKNLGTNMEYKHYPDENLNETITYAQYNNEVTTLNTDTAYLSNETYQNRQKYLTAWTQNSGSHLPSAMSYITSGKASANDDDGDFLTGNDRGEYQVACDSGEFGTVTDSGTQFTGANDDTDNERIWTSAIGHTTGTSWGRGARIVGSTGCGDQNTSSTGYRYGATSARFVVRP